MEISSISTSILNVHQCALDDVCVRLDPRHGFTRIFIGAVHKLFRVRSPRKARPRLPHQTLLAYLSSLRSVVLLCL